MSLSFPILTINSGSSSIKFSLYAFDGGEQLILKGAIREIGKEEGYFTIRDRVGHTLLNVSKKIKDHKIATGEITRWLKDNGYADNIRAIGHRIVHGGDRYRRHCPVTSELITYLHSIAHLAPEHLPHEINTIEIMMEEFPDIMEVACFDTAFHESIPPVASTFALPYHLYEEGIRRFGFHGLSYEYVMETLREYDSHKANGRVIIAHLGHGASMSAVKDGRCIDTTMGFTPAGGIVMSTRTGDLDPGVLIYLLENKGIRADELNHLINHRSGVLGISGITDNMEELLIKENKDPRAKLAIEIFCYSVKKFIGAFSAIMGGLDTLIFTAGIGENSPRIRQYICEGLDFLGIHLDDIRNRSNEFIISMDSSPVHVMVIPTNEELMIARHTKRLLISCY